jgi:hypothetical protein
MAKTKNKKNEQEVSVEPITDLQIQKPEKLEQCEWVFQFDDEEPEVFAWSTSTEESGNLSFILSANSASSMTFVSPHTGKKLNVFSRPMSEETKSKRTDIPDYSDLELKTPEGENV